ncbi:MAG: peptide deformylase [Candidatus Parcubacteria bacterium]|nr:peptide deformylase [Candidatus Parcubacteria bacterium]
MSSLKLIKEPSPILRQKTKEIKDITPEIKQLILDMAQTMKENKGVGLAAPQIGQSIRLCLISTEKGPLALINPQITRKSLRKDIEEEGCLSCPGVWGLVKRAKVIYVKALNQEGKSINFRAEGLFARVIQHELDHLDGILIIDKIEKNKKR